MYFKKLNIQFNIPEFDIGEPDIQYGPIVDGKFYGIEYRELLNFKSLYSKFTLNLTTEAPQLLHANCYIPPHTDSGINAVINYYITTENCETQFYEKKEDIVDSYQIENQTDGHLYNLKDLTSGPSFTAEPGDVYLLDVSKIHSVIPLKRAVGLDRKAICVSIKDYKFPELEQLL